MAFVAVFCCTPAEHTLDVLETVFALFASSLTHTGQNCAECIGRFGGIDGVSEKRISVKVLRKSSIYQVYIYNLSSGSRLNVLWATHQGDEINILKRGSKDGDFFNRSRTGCLLYE